MSGRIEIINSRKEHTSKWSRNALDNKPRINGTQLIGNKDSEVDLGIPKAEPLTNNQLTSLIEILS